DSQAAACRLAGALSVDRPRRPALFPEPGFPGAARRGARAGRDARALPDPRRAGARARHPAVQAGRAVADERCHGTAIRSAVVTEIEGSVKPAIGHGFRLQWEPAQGAHVLLYPEGMVKLNGSAAEILRRCTGELTLDEITADLERTFETTGL